MVLYEVTLEVEPALARQVEEHMRGVHIPEIAATGCFRRIRFARASPVRFRTSYEADEQADLERYLHEHAPRLRLQFAERFPSGVTLAREIWAVQKVW